MTTNESILPDALQPQSADRSSGRDESYWTERNALVDAVRTAGASAPDVYADNGMAFPCWLKTDCGQTYVAALDTLKSFDAAHDGAPIL